MPSVRSDIGNCFCESNAGALRIDSAYQTISWPAILVTTSIIPRQSFGMGVAGDYRRQDSYCHKRTQLYLCRLAGHLEHRGCYTPKPIPNVRWWTEW